MFIEYIYIAAMVFKQTKLLVSFDFKFICKREGLIKTKILF